MLTMRFSGRVLILTGLIFTGMVNGHNYKTEKQLLEYLFAPDRYDKSILPVENMSSQVQVSFQQKIKSIDYLDVPTAKLCVVLYITMSWTDKHLVWNSSDFGGISHIYLPEGKFWTPDLDLQTFGDCERDNDKPFWAAPQTTNDGIVTLFIGKSASAYCQTDMQLFPFDTHLCLLQTFSSKYSADKLKIISEQDNLKTDNYFENQEWKIEGTRLINAEINDTDIPFPYSHIIHFFEVTRRPSSIFINDFLSILLVTFLNLFVPLISPNSEERLSFAITVYLAMVFINISLVSKMPPNSLKITGLSIDLLIISIMYTVGIFWNILIINLSKLSTDDVEIPRLLRFLLKMMSKRVKSFKTFDNNGTIPPNSQLETTQDPCTVDENGESTSKDLRNKHATLHVENVKNVNGEHQLSWMEVCRFMDKVYIAVSLCCLLVLTIVNVYFILNKKTIIDQIAL